MSKKSENSEAVSVRKYWAEAMVEEAIGHVTELKYKVVLNDNSTDPEKHTDFEVIITNVINKKKHHEILRQHDHESATELLVGEGFYDTDPVHFVMRLFLHYFCYSA
jgi:hypothetical protein